MSSNSVPSLSASSTQRTIALPPARGHVLVVDDNAALADNLREVLTDDEGLVEVTVLGTGEKALEVARTRGFDVAIVDVKLPDGSGIDLLQPLREAAPSGEVILITGFATIDAAIAALRGGAFALVLKSFRAEELRSTVEQALVKVALRRERDLLERRYRALVEVADVIVVGLDRDGRVALANPKFVSLVGVPTAAALGRVFWQSWIAEGDRQRFRDAVDSVASSGAPRELEATLISPKIREAITPTASSPPVAEPFARIIRWHFSSEGEAGPLGEAEAALVFGIGVDVTERRELERRAANAEALSTMGTIALGLAHEIRNPLNAAVLQMHLLGRQVERGIEAEAAKASMRDRVHIVVGEIKRLSRLLTEFLELARPRGLAREPVEIDEIVDAVIELHREEATQKGVAFARENTKARGLEAVVVGDREKLKQVFVNLVVNAIEATPRGGAIRVTTRSTDDSVVVELTDTGSGISDQDIARVFDPFFTTKPGGTGLGLSIVRKILEQHQGSIQLRSNSGQGTTVAIELPRG